MTSDDSNIQKMLQAIINSISAFKMEVAERFNKVDMKMDGLAGRIDDTEERLTKRLDKIGRQLAI